MPVFSSREYADRRDRLAEAIGPDAAAVLVAPPMATRSNDTHYRYRTSSDILYLCGFDEPGAVLVLTPGHPLGDFTMFVRPRDPRREQWDGVRAGTEGAVDRYGADRAFTLDELDAEVPSLLEGRRAIHYTFEGRDFDRRILGWIDALRKRRGKPPAAPASIFDLRDVLHTQRQIKSADEQAALRRAGALTAEAHALAMRAARPDMAEYELQALIEYHFARHGATAPAYPSIVAGGARANILHYTTNREALQRDELVLIDAGCELGGYAADVTRTWPIGGRFSPAQRDVYQAVLGCHLALLDAARPGVTHEDLQRLSARLLTQSLCDLGVLDGELDALVEERAYRPYYPHTFGHWLGLDVHDVGPYHAPGEQDEAAGRTRALEPGFALTVEPGLYLPAGDERVPAPLRGIGVRIEDDVLITDEGCEVLTAQCPVDPDAIEALVSEAAPPE